MYRLLDALWIAGVHYLGNLNPITVETDESVLSASVSVSDGSSVVATIPLNYTPSGGRVTIDLSDLLRPYFEFQVLAPRVRLFKQERMMLDVKVRFMGAAQPSLSFRVIRGGISGVEDNVEEWLLKNPLSWQPRRKYVMYNQPEWLTLYLRSGDVIVYTIYTNSKGATPIQAAGLSQQMTSAGVYTINVSPAAIRKLIDIAADDYITFYKVTTTGGVEMQYVLDSAKSEEETASAEWIRLDSVEKKCYLSTLRIKPSLVKMKLTLTKSICRRAGGRTPAAFLSANGCGCSTSSAHRIDIDIETVGCRRSL